MRRVVLAAGAIAATLAVWVPAAPAATVHRDGPAAQAAGLTKNQKVALGAIDALEAAKDGYKAYLRKRPTLRAAVKARVDCLAERFTTYSAQFGALGDDAVKVQLGATYTYWSAHTYKLIPRSGKKFSIKSVKRIFIRAAKRLSKLNPDLAGVRIIRGLRAQVDAIEAWRRMPSPDACQVITQWASSGFDNAKLAPLLSAFQGVAFELSQAAFVTRIEQAIEQMKLVPGITDDEAEEFSVTQGLTYDTFVGLSGLA